DSGPDRRQRRSVADAEKIRHVYAGRRCAWAIDRVSGLPDTSGSRIEGNAETGAGSMSDVIKVNGFTNQTLGWKAWLDVVDANAATPEQNKVLEASHPQAKTSDYYLLLVHEPHILDQRSFTYNAIMYAPGGLNRADREL